MVQWLSFFWSLHHVMMVAVVAGFYVPSNAIVKIKRRIVSSSMIVFLRYERNSLFPINVGEDHCSWIHIPERGREETNDAKTNGVQSILKLLKDQFDDTSSASPSPSTADWTKMRRFLYRVSSHNDHQTARIVHLQSPKGIEISRGSDSRSSPPTIHSPPGPSDTDTKCEYKTSSHGRVSTVPLRRFVIPHGDHTESQPTLDLWNRL